MGKDCLQTFLHLDIFQKRTGTTFKHAWLRWKTTSNRNAMLFTSGIYIFNSCEQNSGESVDSFVISNGYMSRQLSEFGLLNDELIRDRLVIGLIDKGTKRKVLREKSLTLDKALEIARSDEITSQQLASMKSESEPTKEEVNVVEKGKGKDIKKHPSGKDRKGKKREETPKKKKHIGNEKCKFCGKQQPAP